MASQNYLEAASCLKEPAAVLRSLDGIRERQGESFVLTDGMPTGPWCSDVAARDELESWCKNLHTAEGGWAVRWGSKRARRSNRGVQRVLQCFKALTEKCKWQIFLEEAICDDGTAPKLCWAVFSGVNEHTHELTTSRSEANALCSFIMIPENLQILGKIMKSGGLSAKSIFAVLNSHLKTEGLERTLTYSDCYHAFAPSPAERVLDASGFVEALSRRQIVDGLFYKISTDSEGHLEMAFFLMAGAVELYCIGATEKRNVVLFDTKVCV
jgi:hypothetical protein